MSGLSIHPWLHDLGTLPFLADLGIKSLVLLSAAAVAARLLRRSSAALRYSVWLGAMLALLLLPLLRPSIPGWSVMPKPLAQVEQRLETTHPIESGMFVPWDVWSADRLYLPPPQMPARAQAVTAPIAEPAANPAVTPAAEAPAARQVPQITVPRATPSWSISLTTVLYAVWLGGAALVLLPTLRGLLGLHLLRRSATPVTQRAWKNLCRKHAEQLGISRPVRLLSGPEGMMPMTWGIVRPCILLPAEARDWSNQRLRVVLLHELAHIKRLDCLFQFLSRMACALYWFNPLCWVANRQIKTEREQACDDRVLGLTRKPLRYAEHLLEVAAAARLVCGRATSAIAMARISTLEGRLRAILDSDRPRRALSWPAIGLAAGLIAATASVSALVKLQQPRTAAAAPAVVPVLAADPPAKAEQPAAPAAPAAAAAGEPAPLDKSMEVTILDKQTREPLANVRVRLRMDNASRSDRTDDKGRIWIMLGDRPPQYLSIMPEVPDYAPLRAQWQNRGGSVMTLPDKFTFEMVHGSVIGGIVRDEENKPIADATVMIQAYEQKPNGEPGVEIIDKPFRTDAEGKWQCPGIPDSLSSLWVRLGHPDYISDEMYGASVQPSMAELRKQTAVFVMKKGVEVSGKVTDLQGNPLAGARVAQGHDRWGTHYPETRTDAEGVYRFGSARPGAMVLTVQTRGYAPDLREITVAKGMAGVDFKLKEASVIRGQLVDQDGLPVRKAFVAADTWRKHRSIDFRTETDAEGRFVWHDAPEDEVLFDMGKQGYQSVRRKAIKSADEEVVITLPLPLKVSGTVLDDETGQPIKSFQVVNGSRFEGQKTVYYDRNFVKTFTDGKYEVQMDEFQPTRLIRIEAEGYVPVLSPEYTDSRAQVFDVRLKKGHGPSGIVLMPDGKPAKGAQVVLYNSESSYVQVQNGRAYEHSQGTEIVNTGEDGHFGFRPQTDPYEMLILHETGLLEVSREQAEKGGSFRLQAYGGIRGTVKRGGKPMAGKGLTLAVERKPQTARDRVYFSYSATTDADGRFAFDRVPAGQVTVNQTATVRMTDGTSMQSYAPLAAVVVKPGEVVEAAVASTGRRVTGRIHWPLQAGGPSVRRVLTLRPKGSEPTLPMEWLSMTPAQRQAFWEKWRQSPEGQAVTRVSSVASGIPIADDGMFMKDDIPPGAYDLIGYAIEFVDSTMRNSRLVASVTAPVTVAEGDLDTAVNLGEFTMVAVPENKVGDAAPEVTGTDLDGKAFKLADLRGQWVLIDVFSPHWRMPDEAASAAALARKLSKDSSVRVVGVAIGQTREMAVAYAKKYELTWPILHYGEGHKDPAASGLAIRGASSWMLVSPEGKIAAVEFTTADAEAIIAKARSGK